MRLFAKQGKAFCLAEIAASDPAMTPENAKHYFRGLRLHGYLRIDSNKQNGRRGGFTYYRLQRDTGPLPPRFQQNERLYDPNTNELLYSDGESRTVTRGIPETARNILDIISATRDAAARRDWSGAEKEMKALAEDICAAIRKGCDTDVGEAQWSVFEFSTDFHVEHAGNALPNAIFVSGVLRGISYILRAATPERKRPHKPALLKDDLNLKILSALAKAAEGLSSTDIATVCGCAYVTAFRKLVLLREAGLVDSAKGGRGRKRNHRLAPGAQAFLAVQP